MHDARTGRDVQRTLIELRPVPQAAPQARHHVADLVAGTPLAHRADDAALAVSELVSNAVLHGREPLRVVVTVGPDRLRVEVRDGSPISPTFSMLDPTAVTGRGLLLVASCCDRWGIEPDETGKAVWFECDAEPADDGAVDVDALLASWADDLQDPADEVVKVVVTGLDVQQVARSEAHVEGLLRELALVDAGEDGDTPCERAAQRVLHASAAVETMRAEVKRQLAHALAEGLTVLDVVLDITRVDAEAVRDFSHALDEADRLSRTGLLLHEPAPRALSDLRQQYLRRIITQLGS